MGGETQATLRVTDPTTGAPDDRDDTIHVDADDAADLAVACKRFQNCPAGRGRCPNCGGQRHVRTCAACSQALRADGSCPSCDKPTSGRQGPPEEEDSTPLLSHLLGVDDSGSGWQGLHEDPEVFSQLPVELASQARLIGRRPIIALRQDLYAGAELERFLPFSAIERIRAGIHGPASVRRLAVRDNQLTVEAATSRSAKLSSIADAIFALDLILGLRSVLLPATAASNQATWAKFRDLFRAHEWTTVVEVFETMRLVCVSRRLNDWSVHCPEAESVLWQPTRPPVRSSAFSSSKPVPKAEFHTLIKECQAKGLCAKFQASACNSGGDHQGRKHACLTCAATDHGSQACSRKEKSPAAVVKKTNKSSVASSPLFPTHGNTHLCLSFSTRAQISPPWHLVEDLPECPCGTELCRKAPHSLPARWDPEFSSSDAWEPSANRIARELAAFRSALSESEREVFDSGHRLSRSERERAMASFSHNDTRARAWRFADEPVDNPPPYSVAAADAVRHSGPSPRSPPPSMRVDTILMDLWHHSTDPAFLLELEACVDGLQHGVNFLYNGDRQQLRVQANHSSARRNPHTLRAVISRAIEAGHCVGPFPSPPWANLQVHPLGLVPKSSGGFRLVEDASFPHGDSVNHWTDSVPQQYDKWVEVVSHFARAPRNCFFLQFDKSDAYRSIPLRVVDQHLTGFYVPGFGFCFSINMPFGFAASAFLWKRYMDIFLILLSQKLGIPRSEIHAWVDDCLLILSPCAVSALECFSLLVAAARRYSFFLHPTKLFLSRSVTYLGVTLDSTRRTLSIPPAKLNDIRQRIARAVSATSWDRTLAQRLLGSLHHVARCLPLAKAFLGRLVAVLRVHQDSCPFPPPAWALDDLKAWSYILDSWSGTTVSRLRAPSTPLSVFTWTPLEAATPRASLVSACSASRQVNTLSASSRHPNSRQPTFRHLTQRPC